MLFVPRGKRFRRPQRNNAIEFVAVYSMSLSSCRLRRANCSTQRGSHKCLLGRQMEAVEAVKLVAAQSQNPTSYDRIVNILTSARPLRPKDKFEAIISHWQLKPKEQWNEVYASWERYRTHSATECRKATNPRNQSRRRCSPNPKLLEQSTGMILKLMNYSGIVRLSNVSAEAFAKSPQPARRASGALTKLPPSHAPKISPTSATRQAAGLTPVQKGPTPTVVIRPYEKSTAPIFRDVKWCSISPLIDGDKHPNNREGFASRQGRYFSGGRRAGCGFPRLLSDTITARVK